MSHAWIMHIHGLDTKSMSWSPICFNELGSQGERLNFSFEFQTEKVKGALLCQRERRKQKGRAMARTRWPKPPARLHPQNALFVSKSHSHIANIRTHRDVRGTFFCCCFFVRVLHNSHIIHAENEYCKCSYFIQVICGVNWAMRKSSEDNEFHLIPFYYL